MLDEVRCIMCCVVCWYIRYGNKLLSIEDVIVSYKDIFEILFKNL